MSEKRKRITVKLKTPNPLFEKWITEWRDKAKEENSKMEYCFSKALFSLRKFPVPLERGIDCKILNGFGDKICKMLDKKLKEHKKNQRGNLDVAAIENSIIPDENKYKTCEVKKKKNVSKPVQEGSTKRGSPSKEYIPKEGSGAYSILITLYRKGLEASYPGHLTKLELVQEAQFLCNTSFIRPDPGTRYTAWSSMKTLISKKLVAMVSNPAKFSLTDDGLLLAKKLHDKANHTDSFNMFNDSCDIASDRVIIDLSGEVLVPNTSSVSTNSKTSLSSECFSENNIVSQSTSCKSIQKYGSSSSISSSIEKDIENLWNEEVTAKKPSPVFTSSTTTSVSNSSVTSMFRSCSEENVVIGRKQSSKTFKKFTSSSSIASSTQSSSQEESIIFLPNSFDIILYVDAQETGGSNVDVLNDPILAELKFRSVLHEVKNLKVGDYTWICRDRTTKYELILPYIIERKRMDDLGSSIKDGRYHEQKLRLKKSKIQNITYLIENYGKNQHVGLPIATLHQAATNTAVQDGFCVKFTENYKDTAKYLANLSSLLTKIFKSKTLVSCPKENLSEVSLNDDLIPLMTFKAFNKSSTKNKPLWVADLFVKMLLQIKGMSVDKALAIVQVYPTPETLRRAYEENPGSRGEKLLAPIPFGDCKKIIGQVLSKTVYQLFTTQSFQ